MAICSLIKEVALLLYVIGVSQAERDLLDNIHLNAENPPEVNDFLHSVLQYRNDFRWIRRLAHQSDAVKLYKKSAYSPSYQMESYKRDAPRTSHHPINDVNPYMYDQEDSNQQNDILYSYRPVRNLRRKRKRHRVGLIRHRRSKGSINLDLSNEQDTGEVKVVPRSETGVQNVPGQKYYGRHRKATTPDTCGSPEHTQHEVIFKNSSKTQNDSKESGEYYFTTPHDLLGLSQDMSGSEGDMKNRTCIQTKKVALAAPRSSRNVSGSVLVPQMKMFNAAAVSPTLQQSSPMKLTPSPNLGAASPQFTLAPSRPLAQQVYFPQPVQASAGVQSLPVQMLPQSLPPMDAFPAMPTLRSTSPLPPFSERKFIPDTRNTDFIKLVHYIETPNKDQVPSSKQDLLRKENDDLLENIDHVLKADRTGLHMYRGMTEAQPTTNKREEEQSVSSTEKEPPLGMFKALEDHPMLHNLLGTRRILPMKVAYSLPGTNKKIRSVNAAEEGEDEHLPDVELKFNSHPIQKFKGKKPSSRRRINLGRKKKKKIDRHYPYTTTELTTSTTTMLIPTAGLMFTISPTDNSMVNNPNIKLLENADDDNNKNLKLTLKEYINRENAYNLEKQQQDEEEEENSFDYNIAQQKKIELEDLTEPTSAAEQRELGRKDEPATPSMGNEDADNQFIVIPLKKQTAVDNVGYRSVEYEAVHTGDSFKVKDSEDVIHLGKQESLTRDFKKNPVLVEASTDKEPVRKRNLLYRENQLIISREEAPSILNLENEDYPYENGYDKLSPMKQNGEYNYYENFEQKRDVSQQNTSNFKGRRLQNDASDDYYDIPYVESPRQKRRSISDYIIENPYDSLNLKRRSEDDEPDEEPGNDAKEPHYKQKKVEENEPLDLSPKVEETETLHMDIIDPRRRSYTDSSRYTLNNKKEISDKRNNDRSIKDIEKSSIKKHGRTDPSKNSNITGPVAISITTIDDFQLNSDEDESEVTTKRRGIELHMKKEEDEDRGSEEKLSTHSNLSLNKKTTRGTTETTCETEENERASEKTNNDEDASNDQTTCILISAKPINLTSSELAMYRDGQHFDTTSEGEDSTEGHKTSLGRKWKYTKTTKKSSTTECTEETTPDKDDAEQEGSEESKGKEKEKDDDSDTTTATEENDGEGESKSKEESSEQENKNDKEEGGNEKEEKDEKEDKEEDKDNSGEEQKLLCCYIDKGKGKDKKFHDKHKKREKHDYEEYKIATRAMKSKDDSDDDSDRKDSCKERENDDKYEKEEKDEDDKEGESEESDRESSDDKEDSERERDEPAVHKHGKKVENEDESDRENADLREEKEERPLKHKKPIKEDDESEPELLYKHGKKTKCGGKKFNKVKYKNRKFEEDNDIGKYKEYDDQSSSTANKESEDSDKQDGTDKRAYNLTDETLANAERLPKTEERSPTMLPPKHQSSVKVNSTSCYVESVVTGSMGLTDCLQELSTTASTDTTENCDTEETEKPADNNNADNSNNAEASESPDGAEPNDSDKKDVGSPEQDNTSNGEYDANKSEVDECENVTESSSKEHSEVDSAAPALDQLESTTTCNQSPINYNYFNVTINMMANDATTENNEEQEGSDLEIERKPHVMLSSEHDKELKELTKNIVELVKKGGLCQNASMPERHRQQIKNQETEEQHGNSTVEKSKDDASTAEQIQPGENQEEPQSNEQNEAKENAEETKGVDQPKEAEKEADVTAGGKESEDTQVDPSEDKQETSDDTKQETEIVSNDGDQSNPDDQQKNDPKGQKEEKVEKIEEVENIERPPDYVPDLKSDLQKAKESRERERKKEEKMRIGESSKGGIEQLKKMGHKNDENCNEPGENGDEGSKENGDGKDSSKETGDKSEDGENKENIGAKENESKDNENKENCNNEENDKTNEENNTPNGEGENADKDSEGKPDEGKLGEDINCDNKEPGEDTEEPKETSEIKKPMPVTGTVAEEAVGAGAGESAEASKLNENGSTDGTGEPNEEGSSTQTSPDVNGGDEESPDLNSSVAPDDSDSTTLSENPDKEPIKSPSVPLEETPAQEKCEPDSKSKPILIKSSTVVHIGAKTPSTPCQSTTSADIDDAIPQNIGQEDIKNIITGSFYPNLPISLVPRSHSLEELAEEEIQQNDKRNAMARKTNHAQNQEALVENLQKLINRYKHRLKISGQSRRQAHSSIVHHHTEKKKQKSVPKDPCVTEPGRYYTGHSSDPVKRETKVSDTVGDAEYYHEKHIMKNSLIPVARPAKEAYRDTESVDDELKERLLFQKVYQSLMRSRKRIHDSDMYKTIDEYFENVSGQEDDQPVSPVDENMDNIEIPVKRKQEYEELQKEKQEEEGVTEDTGGGLVGVLRARKKTDDVTTRRSQREKVSNDDDDDTADISRSTTDDIIDETPIELTSTEMKPKIKLDDVESFKDVVEQPMGIISKRSTVGRQLKHLGSPDSSYLSPILVENGGRENIRLRRKLRYLRNHARQAPPLNRAVPFNYNDFIQSHRQSPRFGQILERSNTQSDTTNFQDQQNCNVNENVGLQSTEREVNPSSVANSVPLETYTENATLSRQTELCEDPSSKNQSKALDEDEQKKKEREDMRSMLNGDLPMNLINIFYGKLKDNGVLYNRFGGSIASSKECSFENVMNIKSFREDQAKVDIKHAEEMLHEVIVMLNRIVADQVHRKTCLKLSPNLKLYIIRITKGMRNFKKSNQIAEGYPLPKIKYRSSQDFFTGPTEEEQGQLLFENRPERARVSNVEDKAEIRKRIKLIEKLLEKYQRMSMRCQVQVEPVRNYLMDHLQLLMKMLEKSESSITTTPYSNSINQEKEPQVPEEELLPAKQLRMPNRADDTKVEYTTIEQRSIQLNKDMDSELAHRQQVLIETQQDQKKIDEVNQFISEQQKENEFLNPTRTNDGKPHPQRDLAYKDYRRSDPNENMIKEVPIPFSGTAALHQQNNHGSPPVSAASSQPPPIPPPPPQQVLPPKSSGGISQSQLIGGQVPAQVAPPPPQQQLPPRLLATTTPILNPPLSSILNPDLANMTASPINAEVEKNKYSYPELVTKDLIELGLGGSNTYIPPFSVTGVVKEQLIKMTNELNNKPITASSPPKLPNPQQSVPGPPNSPPAPAVAALVQTSYVSPSSTVASLQFQPRTISDSLDQDEQSPLQSQVGYNEVTTAIKDPSLVEKQRFKRVTNEDSEEDTNEEASSKIRQLYEVSVLNKSSLKSKNRELQEILLSDFYTKPVFQRKRALNPYQEPLRESLGVRNSKSLRSTIHSHTFREAKVKLNPKTGKIAANYRYSQDDLPKNKQKVMPEMLEGGPETIPMPMMQNPEVIRNRIHANAPNFDDSRYLMSNFNFHNHPNAVDKKVAQSTSSAKQKSGKSVHKKSNWDGTEKYKKLMAAYESLREKRQNEERLSRLFGYKDDDKLAIKTASKQMQDISKVNFEKPLVFSLD